MFRDVCFLFCSDETLYGELIEDLNKVAYKGGYEYPDTIKVAYEVLVRTSRHIGISTREINIFSSRTQGGGRINLSFAQIGRR